MKVANRVKNMSASAVRQLLPLAHEAEAKGINIYHLNIGQPDIKTPKSFYEGVHHFDEEVLSYCPSQGINDLVGAFADYYAKIDLPFNAKDIIITNGGSESLLFAMLTVCDQGDNILVTEPFYTNYNQLAAIAGVELIPVTTTPENGYRLPSKEAFQEKINDRTRAILESNPANPTGRVLTDAEMKLIMELAIENDLYIISDEVYREFCYTGDMAESFSSYESIAQHVIVIDSISKRYSACGARIGTIASKNHEFMKMILKLAQSRLSVSPVTQVGTVALLKLPLEQVYNEIKEYHKRKTVCFEAFNQIPGVVCSDPEGAFYMMVKLPVDNAAAFCRFMLTDFNLDGETTMMAPGEGFYATPGLGKQEVRIAYVLEEEKIKRAVEIVGEGIKAYNAKK